MYNYPNYPNYPNYSNYTNYPNYTNNYQPTLNTQQRMSQLQQNYPQYNNIENPSQNVTWIRVNGINGAKEHIVQPNQTVWLMDNNDSIFFVKSADNLGVTTLKSYKFFEIDLQNNSTTSSNEYVSIQDFNQLKDRLCRIENSLSKEQKEHEEKTQTNKTIVKK